MLGTLLLIFSATLAVCFGAALARTLRVGDLAGFVVAVLLGAAAQIVLVTELLSLVSLWKPGPLVVSQFLTLVPFGLWFRSAIEPSLFADLGAARRRLTEHELLAVVGREPLAVIGIAVCIALLSLELLVSVAIAPNTWDSMTYHLARVVYWMQNDSVLQYANASARQTSFPINAEVLQGWTMMLWRGDRFAQSIQWWSQLGIVFVVLAAGRDLGYRLRDRTLAACAFLIMPIAVGEASSTMNDMVQAFFTAAAMLFLLRTLRGQRQAAVIFAIAVGLMFGTKSYGMLLAVALGFAALVVAGRNLKCLLRPALLAAAGILALGSLVYGENLVQGEGPLGDNQQSASRVDSPAEIPANAVAVSWRWTMSVPEFVYKGALTGFEKFFNQSVWLPLASWGGLEDQKPLAVFPVTVEDIVGGGLPLLLLVLPAVLLALLRPRSRDELAYAVAALIGFLLIVATLRQNNWIGRFCLPVMALAVPLVARPMSNRMAHALLLVLAVLTISTTGVFSATKSIVANSGREPLLRQDRITQQTVLRPYHDPMIRAVERFVSAGSRLGLASTEDQWEYPYAGSRFERILVRLPEGGLPRDVFERYDLDALLISDPGLLKQPFFRPVAQSGYQQLILRPPTADSYLGQSAAP